VVAAGSGMRQLRLPAGTHTLQRRLRAQRRHLAPAAAACAQHVRLGRDLCPPCRGHGQHGSGLLTAAHWSTAAGAASAPAVVVAARLHGSVAV
jgi:hypothetical protein